LIASKEKIKLQKETVKEAEKNFRDTSLRFKEGISTNTDVLDAQTLLSQARMNYYQAFYDYNIAVSALERAVGTEIKIQKSPPEVSPPLVEKIKMEN
jgi:outer membrane protein TolC